MQDPVDWVAGDLLGLRIPAHAEALRSGGTDFLTEAFQAGGALDADNRVAEITHFEECAGGSTGRKLLISVAYEKPAPGLPTDLFVKFSRDFTDEIRDRAKVQMATEVRFALLSRVPEFPIAVPLCLFADYHEETGTGILIAERIAFGTGIIERHYEKSLDYEMPDQLGHYKALVRANATLAGTHRAGRFPDSIAAQFPFDASKLTVSRRVPYTPQQLENRVARYAEFAAAHPGLIPATLRSPQFLAQLAQQAPRFPDHAEAIGHYLHSRPDLVALCHWNAHVDNAWFWRNDQGELECGLLDWGNASQMNMAMALAGSLTAAETDLLTDHLDGLFDLFAEEFRRAGGGDIDVPELKLQFLLYIASTGLAYLLDAPAMVERQVPELAEVENRLDPRLSDVEGARVQLQLMITFLTLWQNYDFGRVLDEFLARSS